MVAIGLISLPFDVVLAICHAVDALSNRGVNKSRITSTGQVVGHRVVANADIVPDSLLALYGVNKRFRDAIEPILFSCVVFGAKWEARGELRWAIARSRMRGMIQKRSLGRTAKSLVWDCTYNAPWDHRNQSRPQFWTLFAALLQHLSHVESVELGFWSQSLDPYPTIWQDTLLNRCTQLAQEEQRLPAHSGDVVVQARRRQMLLGCVPCFPENFSRAEENEVPWGRSQGCTFDFPSIKSARLRRGSQWFAAHCPNLEDLEDSGYVKKWENFDMALLGRYCLRIRTMRTLLIASPELIYEILLHCPNLEELVILAPAAPFLAQVNGWQIQDMAPLLGKAIELRSLEFSRPTFKGLFPVKGQKFREQLDLTAAAFSEGLSSLLALKLGEFEYGRTSTEEPLRMKQLQVNYTSI